jgi:hypothetical protein
MAERVLTLNELKDRSLDDLIREVARSREPLIVALEDGDRVIIQSAALLKPLPELDGFVPEGWKDAAY